MTSPSTGTRPGFVARHAYVILCAALLPMVILRAATTNWLSDFWEHAAVVGELAQRPWSPLHPMLALDAPHALESPYHLALAFIVRATGLSEITVLGWAGVVNAIVLLATFHAFVRILSRRPMVPFFALLFTILLWGPEPWEWSGFFHLRSFSAVMPYPSTFATSAAFVAVWAARAYLLSGRARWAVATAAAGALVLLTHPATFAFAVIGIGAVCVSLWRGSLLRRIGTLAGGVVVAAGAALAWPYYSLLDLAGSDAEGYFRDNGPILTISAVVVKTAPALIGVPVLALRAFRRWRDPLVLIFAGASAAYLLARFGSVGSLATMLRFAVMALHIAAAEGVVRLAGTLSARWRRRLATAVVVASALVMVAFVATAPGRTAAALDLTTPDLGFLATDVPDDSIVMADTITSLEVPAWGPKVVAWHYAMPFVDDRDARRAAVDAYFAAATTEDERLAILRDWCVDWILVVADRLADVGGAEPGDLAVGGTPAERGRATLIRAPESSCARTDVPATP